MHLYGHSHLRTLVTSTCHHRPHFSDPNHYQESAPSATAIWIGTALFDIVVTSLTIHRTMGLYKAGIHIPLVDLLQQDGQFSRVMLCFYS